MPDAVVPATPEQQIAGFIEKFDAKQQTLMRAVRKALRKRLPPAYELVYDNYNFFVIGFSPTERPSDSLLSIAAGANGVGLCFLGGWSLPDPSKILQGSGKLNRFIRVPSVAVLARPDVDALIDAAVKQARTPWPSRSAAKTIIRSVSAKQRPRRRTAARR